MSKKTDLNGLDSNQFLTLLNIYLSEWQHRDTLLWKQVFKFFYATIVVLFLPNMAEYLKIDLPSIIPPIVFPVAAFLLSILFMYVAIGYCKRLRAVGNTYKRMLDDLPEHIRRDPVKGFWSARMSVILSVVMFVGLLALSVFMFYYYLHTGLPSTPQTVIPDPNPPIGVIA